MKTVLEYLSEKNLAVPATGSSIIIGQIISNTDEILDMLAQVPNSAGKIKDLALKVENEIHEFFYELDDLQDKIDGAQ